MANFPRIIRAALAASTVVLVVAGCGMMQKTSPMVALTTHLLAANEVPPVASAATGHVNAMFNKETNVLRWELKYDNLSGPATAGHFHGPAMVGANAGVALGWASPMSSPMIGQATLTPAQAADLLAGKWYANVHTAKFPGGEIRGQMTVRP